MSANTNRNHVERHIQKFLESRGSGVGPREWADLQQDVDRLCGVTEPHTDAGAPVLLNLGAVARTAAQYATDHHNHQLADDLAIHATGRIHTILEFSNWEIPDDARPTLLEDLWVIVEYDLRHGRSRFPHEFDTLFTDVLTENERDTAIDKCKQFFREFDHVSLPDRRLEVAGNWFVECFGGRLSDEKIRRICAQIGQRHLAVTRYLEAGDLDTALSVADAAHPAHTASICDDFAEHGSLAELVEADAIPDPAGKQIPTRRLTPVALTLLESGHPAKAVPWIQIAVRHAPLQQTLRRIRTVAEAADAYTEEVETALLQEPRQHWPLALFNFLVTSQDVHEAFELWEDHDFDSPNQRLNAGHQLLDHIPSETAPELRVQVATRLADLHIEQRGRDHYNQACECLATANDATDRIPTNWPTVIDAYSDRLDNLPAFRDEAQRAGLLP